MALTKTLISSALLVGVSSLNWSQITVPDGDNEERTAAYLARRDWFVEKNAEVSGDYHSLVLSDDESKLNDWFVETRNAYINYHVIQENDFAPQQVIV
jgi:hypothetical protein